MQGKWFRTWKLVRIEVEIITISSKNSDDSIRDFSHYFLFLAHGFWMWKFHDAIHLVRAFAIVYFSILSNNHTDNHRLWWLLSGYSRGTFHRHVSCNLGRCFTLAFCFCHFRYLRCPRSLGESYQDYRYIKGCSESHSQIAYLLLVQKRLSQKIDERGCKSWKQLYWKSES
jgi:hypothetical protein